jgi:hypothetical protein
MGKAAKAESRGGETRQHPRGATSKQQKLGKTQWLCWGADKTGSHKAGQVVDSRDDLVGQRAVFKTELPHLVVGRADQIELQLKGNAAAAW